MEILVCIKQVPDTVEVKIDPKTGTLIRDGVPSIINHDDKTGIEAALRIKEQLGGTVTVVSMGPPQADVALREALAMGCDEAYLVSAREFGGSDTYATSEIRISVSKYWILSIINQALSKTKEFPEIESRYFASEEEFRSLLASRQFIKAVILTDVCRYRFYAIPKLCIIAEFFTLHIPLALCPV